MVRAESLARPSEAAATSALVNGHFPRRRGLVVLISAFAGFLLTVVWSADFVDDTIGGSVVRALLGHEAEGAPITGTAAGVVFAFVSGLAGTFTACNIAVFGAMAPMLGTGDSRWNRVLYVIRPLAWLSVGMLAVSATYGAIVGLVGTAMPQFSTQSATVGLSPRTIQSMVVFGLIGLVMCYLGLAVIGVVKDPFERVSRRFPNAPMIFMGALIGGFLVGRPFPLFRQMFRSAAESGNPFYGAAAFALQSVGNILLMAILLVLIVLFAGGRLQQWLTASPVRITIATGVGLLVVGVFTFMYWDIRILARRELIPWYPMAPWS
jgi:hypothetical protein